MILPAPRLLLAFGVVVVPFAFLAGVSPEAAWVSVAAIALFAAVSVVDALAGRNALRALRCDLPAVARLPRGRMGSVPVQFTKEVAGAMTLRVGLPLPATFQAEQPIQVISLPREPGRFGAAWVCRALERGAYQIPELALEALSPLGLWARRERRSVACEVRVYPNLSAEKKHAPSLFLRQEGLGVRRSRRAGKGRDFEKLRDYVAGDSFDEIHWKATAKRGKPVTKVFQVERTQEVYVVVDASRLSARALPSLAAGVSETSVERFVNAALLLALAAERQGDRYGVISFSDGVEAFVPARSGKAHFAACREALYDLKARLVPPDFDELVSFLRRRLRKRALLVFLTSLDDPMIAESFLRSMQLIRRQHLVLVNIIRPAGAAQLFSAPPPERFDEIYERLGGHARWHTLRQLDLSLSRQGIRLAVLESEALCSEIVSRYVDVRERQLL